MTSRGIHSAAFTKHFIPDRVWVQKLTEFKQLTQGTMRVQQYEIQFHHLSCFSLLLVAIPAERIQRFVRGLAPKIQWDVESTELLTFEANVKKAFGLETIANRIKFANGTTMGFKRVNSTPPPIQQQQQPQRSRVTCDYCLRLDHVEEDCRKKSGSCF